MINALMVLKQPNSMEEYKREFNKLVNQLCLYETSVSDMLLVICSVKGVFEIHLPSILSATTTYATVQEEISSRAKPTYVKNRKSLFQKPDDFSWRSVDGTPTKEITCKLMVSIPVVGESSLSFGVT